MNRYSKVLAVSLLACAAQVTLAAPVSNAMSKASSMC